MHKWRSSCGVELLPGLHNLAVDSHARLRELIDDDELADIPLAPCTFVCGEADGQLPSLLCSDTSHVVFVYATAWPSNGPILAELSQSLGTLLPVGSRVITIDKQLCSDDSTAALWSFRSLCAPIEAPNYNTVTSTGYVYEVVMPGTLMQAAGRVTGA